MVYTTSNASAGNEVFAYKRQGDGRLVFQSAFPTGGLGNDSGLGTLGNQGGVTLSRNGNWLLVVNPGSNDVSVFYVKANGALILADTEPSNGTLPTSVTIKGIWFTC